jgi:uncharacterized protein
VGRIDGILGRERALVAMVHVGALPGTPRHGHPLPALAEQAVREARLLESAGFDAILLENMHDVPYLRREVGPEIVAGMTMIGRAVRDRVDVPLGVQVLAGANRAALAVAHAIGASFIRAEGFAFAAVADEGLLDEADAGPLLRYRRMIGADDIRILADVKKKHSAHAITADVDIAETAKACAFLGADGVIVTGTATGEAADAADLRAVAAACALPVVVGSGATAQSVAGLLEHADAVIVGSWLKRDGHWRNEPDPARVEAFVRAARR